MEKLRQSMAGLPGKKKNSDPNVPAIPHNVYTFLMNSFAPINVDHRSSHADMIKNVVLEEVREVLNVLYSTGSH
jgi:hypothetical protein